MAPAGVQFCNVSLKLAVLRLGTVFLTCGLLTGAIYAAVRVTGIDALWAAMADTDFVIRRGVMMRSMTLVPYGRIQSVSLHQGPLQLFRRVASVRAELVPGPVPSIAAHIEESRSLRLCSQLSAASKASREAEPPERWRTRVGEVIDATSKGEASGK